MMKILFTRNNLPFSRLIAWATGSSVSHVAVAFDDRIVFHANPSGVHIRSYPWFVKNNTIVSSIEIRRTLEEEEAAYLSITLVEGSWYDFGSVIYWGYRLFLLKLFSVPLPRRNAWARGDAFNCLEVLGELPPWIWPDEEPPARLLSAMTPHEIATYMGADV